MLYGLTGWRLKDRLQRSDAADLPIDEIDGGVNKPVFKHIALFKPDEAWALTQGDHLSALGGLLVETARATNSGASR